MPAKKPPKGPPLLSEKPLAEQIGYFSVLLENVQTQVKVIAEGQEQLRQDLNKKIDGVEGHLSAEIQFTQQALKATKDELKTDIKNLRDELKTDISNLDKKLSDRIDGVEKKLKEHDQRFDAHDRRFDAHDKRFDAHDRRFDTLEAKLDTVVEKVKTHDEEITLLKADSASAGQAG